MKIVVIIALGILFWAGIAVSGDSDDFSRTQVESEGEKEIFAQAGKINTELAERLYSGGESFKYNVSWSGGIKIGEITLEINTSEKCSDCYEIISKITSTGGIIHRLYPVEDIFTTFVKGEKRLPFFSEFWQKEGNYEAHKTVLYDQEKHTIVKQKEGDPSQKFQVDGVVHNEFSSFFASRIMDLAQTNPISIPTFGDDKRHEVVVITQGSSELEKTVFGKVKALKVTPILTFSGLYDKKGDTAIWYTDDECRIPIRIRSKIIIGSLTARLVHYQNPACKRYHDRTPQDNK